MDNLLYGNDNCAKNLKYSNCSFVAVNSKCDSECKHYIKPTEKIEIMKPKKLIRHKIVDKLKPGEWEAIADQDELNYLYALKIKEEVLEIMSSQHDDIMEFVDLIQVAFAFAKQNGYTQEQLSLALLEKSCDKGTFGRIALNNLNPNNPSNELYFIDEKKELRELLISYEQQNWEGEQEFTREIAADRVDTFLIKN